MDLLCGWFVSRSRAVDTSREVVCGERIVAGFLATATPKQLEFTVVLVREDQWPLVLASCRKASCCRCETHMDVALRHDVIVIEPMPDHTADSHTTVLCVPLAQSADRIWVRLRVHPTGPCSRPTAASHGGAEPMTGARDAVQEAAIPQLQSPPSTCHWMSLSRSTVKDLSHPTMDGQCS